MLKTLCLITFVASFLLLLSSQTIYAVSVTINNPPFSISSDSFNLSVTVTGASSGTNYLRADIYKDGTTNYFGETFNGDQWYFGSNGTQYFPITVPDSNPYIIQARIGDTIPNNYDGTGIYKLRIRRYTASGNYNNDEAKASAVPITIIFSTPTQEPTNTPTPTKIPTPTRTPTPTKAPTPTKTPTPTRTPTPTKSPTPTKVSAFSPTKSITLITNSKTKNLSKNDAASYGAVPTSVLGAEATASPIKVPREKENVLIKSSSEKKNYFIDIAIILGAILLIACGVIIYRRRMSQEL